MTTLFTTLFLPTTITNLANEALSREIALQNAAINLLPTYQARVDAIAALVNDTALIKAATLLYIETQIGNGLLGVAIKAAVTAKLFTLQFNVSADAGALFIVDTVDVVAL